MSTIAHYRPIITTIWAVETGLVILALPFLPKNLGVAYEGVFIAAYMTVFLLSVVAIDFYYRHRPAPPVHPDPGLHRLGPHRHHAHRHRGDV
jgi:hypothetical protein